MLVLSSYCYSVQRMFLRRMMLTGFHNQGSCCQKNTNSAQDYLHCNACIFHIWHEFNACDTKCSEVNKSNYQQQLKNRKQNKMSSSHPGLEGHSWIVHWRELDFIKTFNLTKSVIIILLLFFWSILYPRNFFNHLTPVTSRNVNAADDHQGATDRVFKQADQIRSK